MPTCETLRMRVATVIKREHRKVDGHRLASWDIIGMGCPASHLHHH